MELKTRVSEEFDVSEAVFTTEEGAACQAGEAPSRAKVTILKAGRSKNPRNYREGAVRKAAESQIFKGVRMFVNHSDLPPMKRPLTDMVAAVEDTSYDEKNKALVGDVKFFNKEFAGFAQEAKNYMGVSIKALCHGQRIQSGREVVEDIDEILQGHSVDWVVYPAAGGEIQSFSESEEGDEEVDWSKITPDDLRTNAPDLVKAIEDAAKPQNKEEAAVTAESVAEIVVKTLDERERAAREAAQKRTEIKSQVEEAVKKSGLPHVVQGRLIAIYSVAESYDETSLNSAIASAKDELKALGVGPKITGMGASSDSDKKNHSTHPSGIMVSESLDRFFGIKKEGKGDDGKK